MAFEHVKKVVTTSLPLLADGAERTAPTERAMVQRLITRFGTNDAAPRPIEEEGAMVAVWAPKHSDVVIPWLLERGLATALEVVLASTAYELATFEWDHSVWVLRRAKVSSALNHLHLTPWMLLREAIANASPKVYAEAKAVAHAAQRRPWVLRAMLAFIFPEEKSFWSSDDELRVRHAAVDDFTVRSVAVLAALRHSNDVLKCKWFGDLVRIEPKVILKALSGAEAIPALRLTRSFGSLANIDDPDAIRVLGEFADGGIMYVSNEETSEGAWPNIEALEPTTKVMSALASLFTTHRPKRTIGLQLARAFLRELVVMAPKEAAKLAQKNELISALRHEVGAGLPDDEQWVSPWANVPAAAAPKKTAAVAAVAFGKEKMHWAEGQREALTDSGDHRSNPAEEALRLKAVREEATKRTVFIHEVNWVSDAKALALFESIPAQKWYGTTDDLLTVLARFEFAALPVVMAYVAYKSDRLEALELVESPRVAWLMAKGFAKIKKTKATAQAWLERFPQAAIAGLTPELTSKDKARREAAEIALLHLQEKGANTGTEVAKRPTLPSRVPKLPPFVVLSRLPRPARKDGKAALSLEALGEFVTALKATLPETREVADEMASKFTSESLSALAMSLFRQWLYAGGPPKEKWALYSCGVFANDDAARMFGALARLWAPQGNPARAQEAVQMLALMRTPTALSEIYDISRKVQSKALKAKAGEVFDSEAEKLGLSADDLADRIIPDVSEGSLQFASLSVAFDRQLRARLVDSKGETVNELPADTDPDDVAQWAALKKSAAAVGRQQLKRLEQSLGEGRRMSFEHFSEVYVMHPLVRHLSRGLVWGAWRGDTLSSVFMVSDSGLVDLKGPVEPAPDATYGLVHPAEADLSKWKERIGAQAFEQIERKVFASKDVASVRTALERHRGEVETTALLGLLSRGWQRGDAEQGGCYFTMHRSGSTWAARLSFGPGIYLGAPTETTRQNIDAIELEATGPVPASVLSELQRDLSRLRG